MNGDATLCLEYGAKVGSKVRRTSTVDYHTDRTGRVFGGPVSHHSHFPAVQVSAREHFSALLTNCWTSPSRKFRRHFSQKSLVFLAVNLLVVNLLYSIISLRRLDQLENLTCIVIASLLHYFILSSFSWMFIMALIQYLLFVKIFSRSVSAFTRKASVFSQGAHSMLSPQLD